MIINARNCAAILLVNLLVGRPAFGDEISRPPEVSLIDDNKVDLISGSQTLQIKRGSIGSGISEIYFKDYWDPALYLDNNLFNVAQIYYSGKGGVVTANVAFEGSSLSFKRAVNWYQVRYNNATLSQSTDGNTLTLTTKDGEARVYSNKNTQTTPTYFVLISRTQPNGIVWTYDWSFYNILYARVNSIKNNLGYMIVPSYQSDSIVQSDIEASYYWHFVKGLKFYNLAASLNPIFEVNGSYGSRGTQGREVSITTSTGEIWKTKGAAYSSTHQGSSGTFSIKTPSSSSYNITYTPVLLDPVSKPLTTSLNNNGEIYIYTYNWNYDNTASVSINDPLGNTKKFLYFKPNGGVATTGYPTSITDALGRVTKYTVNDGYQITSITKPDLNVDQYEYDSRNNLISHKIISKNGSDDTNKVEYFKYPSECNNIIVCNKPESIVDRNGNITEYTYDPVHGGVITEKVTITSQLQRVRRFKYAQRYAWLLSGGGGYVKSSSPVWLKISEKTCRNTATVGDACDGGSNDEVVTEYDYGADAGPNNLLLKGILISSGTGSIRTCYTYDYSGNRVSETRPLGTGSACP